MQISINARDEILESQFMKLTLKEIKFLKEQVIEKDHEIETIKSMMESLTKEVVEQKIAVEEKKQEA